MNLLLHTCCGPCTIYPAKVLEEEGLKFTGFFFRSNIHPYTECRKREETLLAFAQSKGIRIICEADYDLEGFLKQQILRETGRCEVCYRIRLRATAQAAAEGGFDAFSSTLLYSRYQQHELIKSFGESVARTSGISFWYRDFREGWRFGVDESRRLGMYRQPYCGCIFSEKERYCKTSASPA